MTLPTSPIVLILVAVIGLLIGLLIGFLFLDRDSRRNKSEDIPEELSKDGFSEIVRMLYSPTRKRIVSVVDGEYLRDARTMNADQHARLARVLRIWSDWNNSPEADTAKAEPLAMEALEPAQPEPAAPASIAPAEAPLGQAGVGAGVAATAAESVFTTEPVPPAAASDVSPFIEEPHPVETPFEEPVAAAAQPAVTASDVQNQTIVEQINSTLQDMLPGTAYEKRGLNLQDDQQNGVLVYVGSEKYNSIEAVPYPDAQDLIAKAVTEWEHKYEEA
jgi:hypothetical protein